MDQAIKMVSVPTHIFVEAEVKSRQQKRIIWDFRVCIVGSNFMHYHEQENQGI